MLVSRSGVASNGLSVPAGMLSPVLHQRLAVGLVVFLYNEMDSNHR